MDVIKFLTQKSCSDAPDLQYSIDRKKLVQRSSPTVKCVEQRDKRPYDSCVKARLDKRCRSDHGGPSFVSKASDCTAVTVSTFNSNMDSPCLEHTVKPYKNPLKVRFGDAICQSDCRHNNHVICSEDDNSEESLPFSSKRKTNLRRQLNSMENRIRNAASLELHYLNKAKYIRAKRDALSKFLQSKTCDDTHDTNHPSYMAYVVERDILMERACLKKSKKIHNKRYRWTKIYEHTVRQWKEQSNGSTASLAFGMKRLPPLFPPTSVTRRACCLIVA
jgi:hypothetical protein